MCCREDYVWGDGRRDTFGTAIFDGRDAGYIPIRILWLRFSEVITLVIDQVPTCGWIQIMSGRHFHAAVV